MKLKKIPAFINHGLPNVRLRTPQVYGSQIVYRRLMNERTTLVAHYFDAKTNSWVEVP